MVFGVSTTVVQSSTTQNNQAKMPKRDFDVFRILWIQNGIDEKGGSKRLEESTISLPFLCIVVVVSNGFVGLECTEHTCYDLIIANKDLPHIQAYDILRVLRTVGAATPVILLLDKGVEPYVDCSGFFGVLRQPFSVSELCKIIHAAYDAQQHNSPFSLPIDVERHSITRTNSSSALSALTSSSKDISGDINTNNNNKECNLETFRNQISFYENHLNLNNRCGLSSNSINNNSNGIVDPHALADIIITDNTSIHNGNGNISNSNNNGSIMQDELENYGYVNHMIVSNNNNNSNNMNLMMNNLNNGYMPTYNPIFNNNGNDFMLNNNRNNQNNHTNSHHNTANATKKAARTYNKKGNNHNNNNNGRVSGEINANRGIAYSNSNSITVTAGRTMRNSTKNSRGKYVEYLQSDDDIEDANDDEEEDDGVENNSHRKEDSMEEEYVDDADITSRSSKKHNNNVKASSSSSTSSSKNDNNKKTAVNTSSTRRKKLRDEQDSDYDVDNDHDNISSDSSNHNINTSSSDSSVTAPIPITFGQTKVDITNPANNNNSSSVAITDDVLLMQNVRMNVLIPHDDGRIWIQNGSSNNPNNHNDKTPKADQKRHCRGKNSTTVNQSKQQNGPNNNIIYHNTDNSNNEHDLSMDLSEFDNNSLFHLSAENSRSNSRNQHNNSRCSSQASGIITPREFPAFDDNTDTTNSNNNNHNVSNRHVLPMAARNRHQTAHNGININSINVSGNAYNNGISYSSSLSHADHDIHNNSSSDSGSDENNSIIYHQQQIRQKTAILSPSQLMSAFSPIVGSSVNSNSRGIESLISVSETTSGKSNHNNAQEQQQQASNEFKTNGATTSTPPRKRKQN